MKTSLIAFCALTFISTVQAQNTTNCQCTYTITQSGIYNNNSLHVQPGQTVCIKAGHYNYLRLNNFVGSAGQPIRFTNCGGQVTAGSASGSSGITISNSQYVVFTGTGDPATAYGIKLIQSNSGSGNDMGISVGSLSSDCEIDHVEVAAASFAGIMVKTDPGCDSATWRSNFTMYNVKIHDNFIHDTGGEGIYVGNSFYGPGQTITCGGVQKQVYPHLIYGLEINNNRVEHTGCEGIQYACAPDARVHDNFITLPGQSPFATYQDNGLQIGGGAGGDCYNNTILNSPSTGLIVVGHLGNNRIFNNVISGSGGDGIFCDDRPGTVSGTFVRIINNTINNSGRDAIRLYNEINVNTIANNVMTDYGSRPSSWKGYVGRPLVLEQNATATKAGNYTLVSTSSAGYTDATSNDFTPLAISPLVAAGADASNWGVTFDQLGQSRPVGTAYTIGAYEYAPVSRGRMPAVANFYSSLNEEILAAYPSPCTDQITIPLPAVQMIQRIDVYSVQGRLEKQIHLTTPQPAAVTLSTGDWSGGLYIYRLHSERGTYAGRFVKE